MNRYVRVLLAALLATVALGNSVLVAQTPAPNTTVAAAEQNAAPNPGQGGVDPATAAHPLPSGPQTREEAAADMEKRLAAVSEMQVQAVGRRLNLSASQIRRLRPILAERQKEIRALASDTDGDRRGKLAAIEAKTRERLEGILTPEQKTQFEQSMVLREAERRRHAAAHPRRLPGQLAAPAPGAVPAAPQQ